ncbi:hypothetical protein J7F01_40340 [Streptomyces sp. ISL-22]|uniref:hypothetical protein n=1 Tax=unclassified Streptomyces TaxID=2593676 RepID=UPI001BEA128A|nr:MULTISPECIES: hypothetical protein [unclassified Streptomyces]MBT2420576.1 hypothetical protein [Streptomyces sp. ISL-24]MBT2438265.1 hypothetical protein [Streptomyces sp. ISL-22]
MIRADRVTLLADVHMDFTADPSTWTRNDGRPLTKDEIDQVLNATIEEACAVLRYAQLVIERHEQQAADIQRAQLLAAPYVARLGRDASLDEILAAMPPGAEREELTQLAERITFTSLDGKPQDTADG